MCIVQLNVAYNFKRQANKTETELQQYLIEMGLNANPSPAASLITDNGNTQFLPSNAIVRNPAAQTVHSSPSVMSMSMPTTFAASSPSSVSLFNTATVHKIEPPEYDERVDPSNSIGSSTEIRPSTSVHQSSVQQVHVRFRPFECQRNSHLRQSISSCNTSRLTPLSVLNTSPSSIQGIELTQHYEEGSSTQTSTSNAMVQLNGSALSGNPHDDHSDTVFVNRYLPADGIRKTFADRSSSGGQHGFIVANAKLKKSLKPMESKARQETKRNIGFNREIINLKSNLSSKYIRSSKTRLRRQSFGEKIVNPSDSLSEITGIKKKL